MADLNSIYCPKCHQKTSLITRASTGVQGVPGLIYEIGECNACDFHMLVSRYAGEVKDILPKPFTRPVDDRVESKVKKDFEEALLCLSVGANRGAAALARRALQTICKDKGATKKDLKVQIDELFDKSVITKDLQNWSHEVRYVGNDAAHPNDVDVSKEDAEEIIDLLESLCEVLYVAPSKAANRKRIREGDS